MGRDVKTLVNLWWLQLLKRQILTFLPNPWFGTERSEVRILSPRPIESKTYGGLSPRCAILSRCLNPLILELLDQKRTDLAQCFAFEVLLEHRTVDLIPF